MLSEGWTVLGVVQVYGSTDRKYLQGRDISVGDICTTSLRPGNHGAQFRDRQRFQLVLVCHLSLGCTKSSLHERKILLSHPRSVLGHGRARQL